MAMIPSTTVTSTAARRAADVALVALFALALLAPSYRNLSGSQPIAQNENRILEKWPGWTWRRAALDAFPARFESFYNDHFGFRHKLIDLLNNVRVRLLRSSSSPQVSLGKDGWLYYTHEPVGLDEATTRPFSTAELERWRRMLEGRRDWLRDRSIPYLFVIAPDKQSIYPERLPTHLSRRAAAVSRLDQLLAYLAANSDVSILDLRPALRDAKSRERVYHITDSHWNDRGGFAGYTGIMGALASIQPNLNAQARGDFEAVAVPVRGGDLAQMLGLPRRFPEMRQLLVRKEPTRARWVDPPLAAAHLPDSMQPSLSVCDGDNLPRAVLFRDSFAWNMLPFLREHFREMLCVWQEPYEFDAAIIERERPDIVIQQIVERKLAPSFPETCRAGIGADLGKPSFPVQLALKRNRELHGEQEVP
jgi:hypothetical protein